jgi:tRNA(Ile)-lysidine synthase
MSACRSDPVGKEELASLFGALSVLERVGLLVSGGCDSTALMVLFADWLADRRGEKSAHTVLTVDHRLRPHSCEEAQAVAHAAAALGFAHATLVWEGEKPTSGLQAAARRARYRLTSEYAARHGIATLLTAHTADDQAETLLMRLARGSGICGLAGMASHTPLLRAPCLPRAMDAGISRPLAIVRPLLGLPKARLRATLRARAIAWREDPSNLSPQFERTRLRAVWGELEQLGLTSEKLALSARRLGRASAALEQAVEEYCDPAAKRFATDRLGFIRIDAPALHRAPAEIAVRLIGRAVAAAGGARGPVPLARLEAIGEAILRRKEAGAWTLARAKITATPSQVLVEREEGRSPLPALVLEAGREALWDRRFLVRAGSELQAPVEVRALGATGLAQARRLAALPRDAPAGALRTLPAFCRSEHLLAVPNLGIWQEPSLRGGLFAVFAPAGSCNLNFK